MYHLYLAPAPNCDAAEAQHQCLTFILVINVCLCVFEPTWILQGISAKLAGWRETGVAPRGQTRLTREERVEISTMWWWQTLHEHQITHTHTLTVMVGDLFQRRSSWGAAWVWSSRVFGQFVFLLYFILFYLNFSCLQLNSFILFYNCSLL